ncbi:hypothetical protein ACFFUR_12395 [Echinicola jeungdonensis]|uniref:Uncharacterized protein n=1 Tax=Echinicola jeungdonensis TaxID=709343 RepID=A0ABV5J724_9BACT
MGWAQTLKYLGEESRSLSDFICAAVVYSIPCNLPSSAATLRLKGNRFYRNKFLSKLKMKFHAKGQQFPGLLDLELLDKVKDFDVFDDHFTAPLHGFKDGNDFYSSVSPDNWMEDIGVPTLVVNALNDPLLGEVCFPRKLAHSHSRIFLETPSRGGHTGFSLKDEEIAWVERRMLELFNPKLDPTI